MGLLQRINPFRKESKGNIGDFLFTGGTARSGIAVTKDRALQHSVALACGRVIANGIAGVPLKIYKETASGGKTAALDHPLYRILSRRPNEWQTSFEFREMLTLHLVFTGNAYALKIIVRGQLAELIPIDPSKVQFKKEPNGEIIYTVSLDNGQQVRLGPQDLLHIRGPSWDGYLGLDPVRYGREALGLSLAMETHAARTFKNGASYGSHVEMPGTFQNKEQIERFKESLQQYQGSDNAGKTPVFEGGTKLVPNTMDFQKAQFIEGRKFQIEDICRVFGVLPIMIGYSDKTATYASAEAMFTAHVVNTLQPWAERWEQALERCLLTDDESFGREPLIIKFSLQGLLRGDSTARSNFYQSGVQTGWMTRNEVRAKEEMNPLPGLDEPLTPLNMGGANKIPAPNKPALEENEEDDAAI
jgi:HK97 family phage portal protein